MRLFFALNIFFFIYLWGLFYVQHKLPGHTHQAHITYWGKLTHLSSPPHEEHILTACITVYGLALLTVEEWELQQNTVKPPSKIYWHRHAMTAWYLLYPQQKESPEHNQGHQSSFPHFFFLSCHLENATGALNYAPTRSVAASPHRF